MTDISTLVRRVDALENRISALEAQILPAVRGIATDLAAMRVSLEAHMAADQKTMSAWARDLNTIKRALSDG